MFNHVDKWQISLAAKKCPSSGISILSPAFLNNLDNILDPESKNFIAAVF